MSERSMIGESATRIFAELADPQQIIHSADDAWKTKLWSALADVGLAKAWADESQGGYGLSISDGFAAIRAAGRAGLAVPLADTMVANWLLARAGIPVLEGPLALAQGDAGGSIVIKPDGTVDAHVRRVCFASEAEHLVLTSLTHGALRVAVVPVVAAEIKRGASLAGDALDSVTIRSAPSSAWAEIDASNDAVLMQLAALTRAVSMAGALETALQLSVTYAQERVAFEKPIGRFQAVQQNLARLAGEVAAAIAVAEGAVDAFTRLPEGSVEVLLEVASAKIRCGEAAETAAAIAHQVHGAIGYSAEHVLHRFTLRALAWRDEFGSESLWARRLGQVIAARGSSELWPLLAQQ